MGGEVLRYGLTYQEGAWHSALLADLIKPRDVVLSDLNGHEHVIRL